MPKCTNTITPGVLIKPELIDLTYPDTPPSESESNLQSETFQSAAPLPDSTPYSGSKKHKKQKKNKKTRRTPYSGSQRRPDPYRLYPRTNARSNTYLSANERLNIYRLAQTSLQSITPQTYEHPFSKSTQYDNQQSPSSNQHDSSSNQQTPDHQTSASDWQVPSSSTQQTSSSSTQQTPSSASSYTTYSLALISKYDEDGNVLTLGQRLALIKKKSEEHKQRVDLDADSRTEELLPVTNHRTVSVPRDLLSASHSTVHRSRDTPTSRTEELLPVTNDNRLSTHDNNTSDPVAMETGAPGTDNESTTPANHSTVYRSRDLLSASHSTVHRSHDTPTSSTENDQDTVSRPNKRVCMHGRRIEENAAVAVKVLVPMSLKQHVFQNAAASYVATTGCDVIKCSNPYPSYQEFQLYIRGSADKVTQCLGMVMEDIRQHYELPGVHRVSFSGARGKVREESMLVILPKSFKEILLKYEGGKRVIQQIGEKNQIWLKFERFVVIDEILLQIIGHKQQMTRGLSDLIGRLSETCFSSNLPRLLYYKPVAAHPGQTETVFQRCDKRNYEQWCHEQTYLRECMKRGEGGPGDGYQGQHGYHYSDSFHSSSGHSTPRYSPYNR